MSFLLLILLRASVHNRETAYNNDWAGKLQLSGVKSTTTRVAWDLESKD